MSAGCWKFDGMIFDYYFIAVTELAVQIPANAWTRRSSECSSARLKLVFATTA